MLKLKSMMKLKDVGSNEDESKLAPTPPIPEKVERTASLQQVRGVAGKPSFQQPNSNQQWTGDEPFIRCPYRGRSRPIHPAVCQWHRERNGVVDLECVRVQCPRVKL